MFLTKTKMDIQWYEDNPAACLTPNGSKKPTRVWGRVNGRMALAESDCQSLYCPECPRQPYRSEKCVQRKTRGIGLFTKRKPPQRHTKKQMAARVGKAWLEKGSPPCVSDMRVTKEGEPSMSSMFVHIGKMKDILAAGRDWLRKEGKWDDKLEEEAN